MPQRRINSDPLLMTLAQDLVATADSFAMAKAYGRWAIKAGGFASARLIWPDSEAGRPLRQERIGGRGAREGRPLFSVRFRDQGSVYFRIDFYGPPKTKRVPAPVASRLRSVAKLVERAIAKNETRLQREELNRFHWIRQFSAGISHELNTPLTTFLFYAQKMARGNLDAGFVEPVKKSVASVTAVLSRYRQLTGDGEFLSFQHLPARDFAARLEAHVRELYPERPFWFSFQHAAGAAPVSVRPEDIERLVAAVVKNAVDAIERVGTPEHPGRIQIRFRTTAQAFQVIITDNGAGIPAQNRAFVFAPFFTTKEVNEGMGLGLSLARAIAFMHDGTLRLNPLSERTQFILQLPLTKAHALPEAA